MTKRFLIISTVLVSLSLLLTACSNQKQESESSNNNSNHTIALITTYVGVDDNSFQQSAWQGFKAYGKEHDLSRGDDGYQYFQSNTTSEFIPNIDQAVATKFKTIFGVGYPLKTALSQSAKKYPKTKFVMIDEHIRGQKNVVNANFKSQDASYLAGVLAAYTTKTNIVGFIGGTRGHTVNLFDAGFTSGVNDTAKKLHKNIKILNQYADSFNASDKGKTIAHSMYSKNADIIFHASGKTGEGVFKAAKELNQTRPVNDKVWVIGVDSNQNSLGNYEAKGGQKSNFTLTSVITGIDVAIKDIANRTYKGNFPGGQSLVYGLKNNGVSVIKNTNISNKAWTATQKARQKILAGKIKVPTSPSKY